MFKVGQPVWDILHGEGTVLRADETHTYPVRVKFTNGGEASYTLDGKYCDEHSIPALYPYHVEITKKVTKPTVNWDHVNSRYNYLAQDESGTCWVYEHVPILIEDEWASSRGDCTPADCLQSLVPGTCDWKDSLVERPTGNSGVD